MGRQRISKRDDLRGRVMVRLDDATIEAFEAACIVEHRDKSSLARHAIMEYLAGHGYMEAVDKPRGR